MSRVPHVFLLLVLIASTVMPSMSHVQAAAPMAGAAGAPDDGSGLSFDPTALSGMQPANPDAAINLIEPPLPNNTGSLHLQYPIHIPEGRVDMQPELAIVYDSSSHNGWLGMGWNLVASAIMIDTRWGVPRYDSALETESYLIDGEELTPIARVDPLVARNTAPDTEKIFHLRVEGSFNKIVRHGTSPQDYTWELVEQNGTRYIYGDGDTPGEATLRDGNDNIFHWALRQVVDISGNTINYHYEHATDSATTASDAVQGDTLYLSSIDYTGSGDAPGPYTVNFLRQSGRPDVQVSGRGGFLEVTAQLLDRIEVRYNGAMVRSYDLTYSVGPFSKSLLRSITQFGADGTEFNVHTFEYYNDIDPNEDGDFEGFATKDSWNTHDDGLQQSEIPDFGSASALSGSTGFAVNGNLYIGFNPDAPSKQGSFGGKVGFAYGETSGDLILIDINGDLLLDKVFKKDGQLSYRLNTSGAHPSAACAQTFDCFSDDVININTPVDQLSHEYSVSLNGGAEAYVGIQAIANVAGTLTVGDVYFIDVNNDGLPDLVNNGVVYFNHLDSGTGTPVFTKDNPATTADSTAINQQYQDLIQAEMQQFPLQDTLRRWIAPYSGTIRISGDVTLGPDSLDGVRVAIQHNGNELWSDSLSAGESATPGNVGSIAVSAGDRVYFRVGSISDGQGDEVAWDPAIVYLDGSGDALSQFDVNGLDLFQYRASEGFTLGGRPGIGAVMPLAGTVRLEGTLNKVGPTTDSITVEVIQNPLAAGTVLFSETLPPGTTGSITLADEFTVAERDMLVLRVRADSPIDHSQLSWGSDPNVHQAPNLFYVAADDGRPVFDQNGAPVIAFPMPYDIDTYPSVVLSAGQTAGAPQQSWTADAGGSITVTPSINYFPGLPPTGPPSGSVTFTVKRWQADGSPGDLLLKETLSIPLDPDALASFTVGDLEAGDQLYFDFSSSDPLLSEGLSNPSVTVQADPSFTIPSALHRTLPATSDELHLKGLFALPYRSWAYAGYNASFSDSAATSPLVESRLVFDPSQYNDTDKNYDPATASAYLYTPDPAANLWRGPSPSAPQNGPQGQIWVSAAGLSSSRLGSVSTPAVTSSPDGRAVPRLSIATQFAFGLGVGIGVSIDASLAGGGSWGILDYLDMNGDGYPDIVSFGRVQYTGPNGDYITGWDSVPGLATEVRSGNNVAVTVGVGGTVPLIKANSKGKTNAPQQASSSSQASAANGDAAQSSRSASTSAADNAPKENKSASEALTLGLSGQFNYGSSNDPDAFGPISEIASELVPMGDLVDLNGDGLPDRILVDNDENLYIQFNLGYGFTDAMTWGSALVDKGESLSGSIGPQVGFNSGDYEFAGGISLGGEQEVAHATLVDMNGDGLPDRVSRDSGELRVGINTGNGFRPDVDWTGAIWNDQTVFGDIGGKGVGKSVNVSIGGGVYFTIPIGPLCIAACYLIINPGGDFNYSMARQDAMFADINGDGYVDSLTSNDLLDPSDASMWVATNQTGRTNLLKSVERPLGGSMAFEYERDGNTFEQPYPLWVFTKLTIDDGVADGGSDTQVTTFEYEGNSYSVAERDLLGYAVVTENTIDPSSGNVYRSVIYEFHNENYYVRGLLKRQATQDGGGRVFVETVNSYALRDIASGQESPDLDNITPANFPLIESTTASLFPHMTRSEEHFPDAAGTIIKSTFMTLKYDAFGNVIETFDSGDAGTQDDARTLVTFSDCPDTWVRNIPTSIVVISNGNELRRQESTVPCELGAASQTREYLADGSFAPTDFEYHASGNVQTITGPPNLHNQRYVQEFQYDPETQTHPSLITDSFGYTTSATYIPLFGLVASLTDENNQTTSFTYDEFGRLTSITGPYEQGGAEPTVTFEYHSDVVPAWAQSRHIDSLHGPGQTIDMVTFVDGLARIIQTKRDMTIFSGPDNPAQDVVVVSGRMTFDFVGRVVEEYHPTVEPLGTPGAFVLTPDGVQPTRVTFDVLDRITEIVHPDNATELRQYGFGTDRTGTTQFLLQTTDPNGYRSNTYTNVRDLITSAEDILTLPNGTQQPVWTSYTYDAVDQLVAVLDDQNNVTTVTYDNFGRRTSIDSPDAGKTDLVYDLADNVIAKITANLRAENEQISYDYDFTRLTGISYPNFPGNNVTYSYGAPGASDNRAGRITVVTSEAGAEERFYGRLGEVVRELKTVAGHAHSPTYTTEYTYDSLGRMLTMIYPDGEVLTYGYDSGGMPSSATGSKLGHTYDYVTRREYDKFGRVAFVEFANGARMQYTYRADNLRLENLQATGATGQFQNLNYTYDPAGNVVAAANDVPVPPASQYGGPTSYTYSYDSLYRLTGAAGIYRSAPNKTRRYNLSMTYDSIDNILTKNQLDEVIQGGGKPNPQGKTTYTYNYEYDGQQPHAPTHISVQTYTYDANGNQTGWTHDQTGQRRTIEWDEENRIQSLFDNGHEKTYAYDDQGQRVIKRGPQGETAYVNAYYTVRNGEIETKHVWIGNMRVASKLVTEPSGDEPAPYEQKQYYFHADRLGSSNFVTDENGLLFQHLEYFAFGETWVEEHSNVQRTPYLFTGKELDEETGLYYFGARYYDPRANLWQSADPALGEFLAGLWDGGVYNRSNLNLFSYVGQNPTTFIDPDGRGKPPKWKRVVDKAGKAAYQRMEPKLQRIRQDLLGEKQGKRHALVGESKIGKHGKVSRIKATSGGLSAYAKKGKFSASGKRLRGEPKNTKPKHASPLYSSSFWLGLAGELVGPNVPRYVTRKIGFVDHYQDTEAKVMNEVLKILKKNPNESIDLTLIGTLPPCASCSSVMTKALNDYPNLSIRYMWWNKKRGVLEYNFNS